jgi:hypothetical protein
MFVIKWVAHHHETEPVEVENSELKDLDHLVLTCQGKLEIMRQKHAANPPHGFLICNSAGAELRRWFGYTR